MIVFVMIVLVHGMIAFVTFVETISITYIILPHTIFESSAMLSSYLPLSQIHVIGLQL